VSLSNTLPSHRLTVPPALMTFPSTQMAKASQGPAAAGYRAEAAMLVEGRRNHPASESRCCVDVAPGRPEPSLDSIRYSMDGFTSED
jgi:hypothetical protein